MSTAAEQVAQQYAAAAINKKQWGSAMYNVLSEGLAGGGVVDDTAKLQALVDKAIAEGRKAIFFPHGTNGQYRVTALTNADQVVFFGDNATFVGGYTGTINQIGKGGVTQSEFDALEADYAKGVAPVFYAEGYGAKGDNLTDDTAAIQAAVDAAEAVGGGTVVVGVGRHVITSTITVTEAVLIKGMGDGDTSTNPNGSSIGVTTFRWAGASGGTMFHFKSATPNEYLFGAGLEGCLLNGGYLANTGVRASSVSQCTFKYLDIRTVLSRGVLIDSANGVLSFHNFIEKYNFVWGVTATAQNAHALELGGTTDGMVTQTHVKDIVGLVNFGHLIKINWSDNNIFDNVHGNIQPGGTGKTIYLANAGSGAADNNVFRYVVGPVHAESNTRGNRIFHYISEGGLITADPGSQLHYEALDYVNAELFTTHKYVMSDQKDIPIGSFTVIDGSALSSMAALQWSCFNLPDAADSRIGVSVPPPFSWNNGTFQTIRIWFTTDTANTSKQWRCRFKAMASGNNTIVATPEVDSFANIPVADVAYTVRSYDLPLALAYKKDDLLFISIQRIGADALDTALGNIQIFGVSLIYQGTGPDSVGSGTYAVTPPFK